MVTHEFFSRREDGHVRAVVVRERLPFTHGRVGSCHCIEEELQCEWERRNAKDSYSVAVVREIALKDLANL